LRHMLLDAEAKRTPKVSHGSSGLEEPFVRGLRRVRERYAGKDISTSELLAVFEEDLPPSLWYEGRRSLDWFLQAWVQGTAVPHFGLQSVRFSPKASGTLVSGVIVQKEGPSDLVTAVPVYAVLSGIQTLLGQVLVDGPETSFRLSAPAGTKKIVLDPKQTLLRSIK